MTQNETRPDGVSSHGTTPAPDTREETKPALTSEDYGRLLLAELGEIIETLRKTPPHLRISRAELDAQIDAWLADWLSNSEKYDQKK